MGVEIHGDSIQIVEEKADEVKLLLHKFLRREGLTGYRVFSQSGTIRVAPDNRFPPKKSPLKTKSKESHHSHLIPSQHFRL